MPVLSNKAQQTVHPLRGVWGQWSDLAPASKIVIGMRTNSLELRLVIRRQQGFKNQFLTEGKKQIRA